MSSKESKTELESRFWDYKTFTDKFGNKYQATKFTENEPYILDFVNHFGLAFYEKTLNTLEEIEQYIKTEEGKL